MWIIWDTKVIEKPLFKKLVGLKFKNVRPKEIILSDLEHEELWQDAEKGRRYAAVLEMAIQRKPS